MIKINDVQSEVLYALVQCDWTLYAFDEWLHTYTRPNLVWAFHELRRLKFIKTYKNNADMHSHNLGLFCRGGVAIDINSIITVETLISIDFR